MARKRRQAGLREGRGYYVTTARKPDRGRMNIRFGPAGARPAQELYAAFAKQLQRFEHNPQKVLSFKSPYQAIQELMNPGAIVTVGRPVDNYIAWAEDNLPRMRDDRESPKLVRVKRLRRFLQPYLTWPVDNFGWQELKAVQRPSPATPPGRARSTERSADWRPTPARG